MLECNTEDRTLQVWFYIHAQSHIDYDPELPLAKWHATPEWYDDSNKAVLFPKAAAKDKLYMRDGDFTGNQVTLIATGISLQRGKLPESVLRASDEWLKRASKRDRRALRALSYGQG